ncbi:hypothetical protein ABBQ38_000376 [Trebouxia sp. C0009 RCD-2024]
MDSSMADQLHFIDQQLLLCELSPGDEAAVDEFTVWSLQFRQQRHNELGHFPDDMVERSAWQARKQRLDESMEPEIESERLLRGLTQVWEKHQERERLRELRGHLLEGSSSELSGPATSLTHRQAILNRVHHISGPPTQPLRQVQPDQGLLTQQHFMQPEHTLVLSQQLHQQPMSVLPGLAPSMPSPCPPLQLMQGQSALPVGSSDSQHSQLGPQPLPGGSQPSTSYSRQEPAPSSAQEHDQQKVCRICHEVKSLADYHRNKVNADGHNSMCKTCAAEYDKEKRRRRQRVHEPTLTEKECPHCKKIKAAEGFYRYSLSQDGLYNICKVCHADQAKARQEAKAGMCPPAEKVCSSCRLTKPSTEFYTNKTAADMLHSLCKQCHGDKCRSRASGNYDVSVVDKHCRSCGQVKASEEFPRNRMNKDGLHSYCKPCQNAKCAQYQRNSLAAKQEGKPVADSPADVAPPDEPFATHKECKACHEAKPLSEYYRSVTNRDGLVSKCKRCMAQSNQRKLTEPTVGEKRCSECGEHKPASQFYKNRTNKDGLFGKCKLCSEGTKKERALNDVTVERKVCKSCGEEKAASDFTRYRMRRDGLYNWCKQCDIWKRQERRKRKRDEAYTMTGGMMQGQGMHDDGSMDPDDDLAGDDGKSDDMTNVFHGAHAHMHSIPHNPHQMGQPVPGDLLAHSVCFMVHGVDKPFGCNPLQHASLLMLHVCAERFQTAKSCLPWL